MTPFLAILLGLYVAMAIGLAVWAILTPGKGLATRISRRVGLTLPPEPLSARIVQRARRTARWTSASAALGALTGVAAVAIVAAMRPLEVEDTGWIWLAFAGVILGGAIGAVLAILTEPHGTNTGTQRVARPARRELSDYLDPIELNGARISTALAAVVAAGVLLVPAARTPSTPAPAVVVGLAIAGMVALGMLELAGRRVVLGRSRISESPAELAWDDALRADDLRRLVTAVLMTSLYAVMFGGYPLIGAAAQALLTQDGQLIVINLSFYLLVGAAITIAVIATVRNPGRYYLRRLWPEVAAAEATATVAR